MDDHLVTIELTSSCAYTIDNIEKLYEDVFVEQAGDNFFLSKEWICGWIECAKKQPELITFFYNQQIVGFTFIGCVKTKLGKVYYLNQTGDQQDDQIWIEYNDVICASHHKACRQALLDYFSKQTNCFQFVVTNAIDTTWLNSRWKIWSNQAIDGFSTKIDEQEISHHFSKNTKKQISRSFSYIQKKHGEIQLECIANADINDALDAMAVLHKKQWGSHAYGSGFSNAQFVKFHKQLLHSKVHNKAEIIKFNAGDFCLGYLYYFTLNKRVFFYLSAINYHDSDNKYKPGLVMHKLAMQHFKELGYTEYDFLAGQARYKTSLSNQDYLLYNIKLYQNKWYYWPIKQVVNGKRWLSKKSSQQ